MGLAYHFSKIQHKDWPASGDRGYSGVHRWFWSFFRHRTTPVKKLVKHHLHKWHRLEAMRRPPEDRLVIVRRLFPKILGRLSGGVCVVSCVETRYNVVHGDCRVYIVRPMPGICPVLAGR